MKNKRLMGIIGLIAAAVIGTAIYSATAGKDNKTASSNEKAKVGVLQNLRKKETPVIPSETFL